MGWDTVLQVLAMLLGTGVIYKHFFHEKDAPLVIYSDKPAPAITPAGPEDALKASLRAEMETLASQKAALLKAHQEHIADGLHASAGIAASAIAAIAKRMDKIRTDWDDWY